MGESEHIKSLEEALKLEMDTLAFERDETHNILKSMNINEIKDQSDLYMTYLTKCLSLQREIRQLKLKIKTPMEEIKKWDAEVTLKRQEEKNLYNEMIDALNTLYMEEKSRERRQKDEEFEKQMEMEKLKLANQEKRKETKEEYDKVRLPKLVISKFQGTHIDWWRFWNQFEAEIDKQKISKVTKFSYLKELLVPKVKLLVDGLPFTSEGYERAKAILQTKYGQTSEVVNAHVQKIINLPVIHGTNPNKIYEFYESLVSSVQALETMGKLIEIKGHVRVTLDKLPNVRPHLVQLDDDWKQWGFPELVEALRKWTERNPPISTADKRSAIDKHDQEKPLLQTKLRDKLCIFCESENHRSLDCSKVSEIADRKAIIKRKRLCFNCTRGKHRAADCTSKGTCRNCGERHHTSICEKGSPEPACTTRESNVVYPVVIVEFNGIPCRALLDTGAGSSYASSTLIRRAALKPTRTVRKTIQMMLHTTTKNVSNYSAEVCSKDKRFKMQVEVNEVDKPMLLTVPNPNYQRLIKKYRHLSGVNMTDIDKREELPVHLVLGAAEYSKIKTSTNPRVGKSGEPVAELTRLGWTMISPGKDRELENLYLTHSPVCDYEELCRLDVLGLKEKSMEENDLYEQFTQQLGKTTDGRYETNLMWKQTKNPLRSNEKGSLGRLQTLLRKLKQDPELFDAYDKIIQEQINQGIVEKVNKPAEGVEFYLPHKPVVRKSAESTKVRIVYDASAKESDDSASLNDCVEVGPALQNRLWEVLLRNRLNPVALTGDMKQAFLQICIREKDRDALRFYWVENKDPCKIIPYRFTRVIFGLGESPFLLGGTVKEHLNQMENAHPKWKKEIKQIERDLYVDDIISGGCDIQKVTKLKETAIKVFSEACIELHKWHSNEPLLEETLQTDTPDSTYAKQQLGVKETDVKILGMHWNKEQDKIAVNIIKKEIDYTKRGLLKFLASIYDPLGIISPTTLIGKTLYRDSCDLKLTWDEKLPKDLQDRIKRWWNGLPELVPVPRSIPVYREQIKEVDLHVFCDASKEGVSAAIYAVVTQDSGQSQALLVSKSRLSSKGLTIPRLELNACYMAANLIDNTRLALNDFNVKTCTSWTDSTVALHWIRSNKEYKQFVNNRVKRIRDKGNIQWRYVPTKQNPADIGSRGCHGNEIPDKWLLGPEWLKEESQWPSDIEVKTTEESEAEAKLIKEVMATTAESNDTEGTRSNEKVEVAKELLTKFKYRKAIRILSWVRRFLYNSCNKQQKRLSGPLTTEEIEIQAKKVVKKEQEKFRSDHRFADHKLRLNLQENKEGILECQGRIQGDYPIYIPPNTLLAEKLCESAHYRTLHGGVIATMAEVRRKYWIPKLRQLAKRLKRNCHWCKRFGIGALRYPGQSNLPKDRTQGTIAFQVVGTDFAGPLTYLTKQRKEKKAYILIFTCSLSRAIHLELIQNQTTEEFIRCLKRFIARRGRPNKIYSDNAQTFKAAAKWLYDIMKSEKLRNYLSNEEIKWQFNLSKAPWWGGQFERLIGLVKQSLYKTLGRAKLRWSEFEEVILDIENTLNNRPLSYVEDDIQYPVITPNSLVHGIPTLNLLEDEIASISETELRKRAKYIMECKNRFWERWRNEYLKSLRERHDSRINNTEPNIKKGDVVIIKGDEKNRGKWKLGIVDELFPGRDGIVRGVRLRAGKTYLERAVQHLYPLELSVERVEEKCTDETTNDDKDEEQQQPEARRSKRMAAANARAKMKVIREDEEDNNDIDW